MAFPFKDRKRDQKKDSSKQEFRAAARLGGKVVKGSGNGATKGDVRTLDFLVECKTRIQLPVSWTEIFAKTAKEAAQAGLIPAVEIESRDGSMKEPWVAIPASAFKLLADKVVE